MRSLFHNVAIVTAILACPSLAQTQHSLSPLIGAEVEAMSAQMSAGGYSNVKGNYWWQAEQRDCLYLPMTGGRLASVTVVKPAVCGMAMRQRTGPGAGCPLGSTREDHALFPDCRNIMAGR